MTTRWAGTRSKLSASVELTMVCPSKGTLGRPAGRGPLLDARDARAELRRANGRDVAAGAGAHDDEVETVGHDVTQARPPGGRGGRHTSSSNRSGFSIHSFTRTRKRTASRPS